MKTYTFNELKKIAKDQEYKTASLENSQGDKITGYNQQGKSDLIKHLAAIEKRLSAEILPNGTYWVCMAHNIPRQKNPDKYAILKGNVLSETPNTPAPMFHAPAPDVLTWGEALKLHSELAQLREENKTLKAENLNLQSENAELRETDLSEETPPAIEGIGAFLKEQAPVITSVLDEYFKTKNRALDIEEKKLNIPGANRTIENTPGTETLKRIVNITPGTPQHLAQIENFFNKGNEARLNEELDKLQAINGVLYNEVMQKLGLNE